MATKDLRRALGKNMPMAVRSHDLVKIVDFAEQNAAAADVLQIFDIPKGWVFERGDVFLLTAEGAAGTIDIGISGDTDGFLDDGNVNGTVGAKIALGVGATIAAGTRYTADTTVQIIANAALDAAKIKIVLRGYMTDA